MKFPFSAQISAFNPRLCPAEAAISAGMPRLLHDQALRNESRANLRPLAILFSEERQKQNPCQAL
jgi:hypothetical protein